MTVPETCPACHSERKGVSEGWWYFRCDSVYSGGKQVVPCVTPQKIAKPAPVPLTLTATLDGNCAVIRGVAPDGSGFHANMVADKVARGRVR